MLPERDRLIAGAAALGLALSDAQCDALLAYQALIIKWTRVYNLTAVRDPSEMLSHHLLDSLAIVPALQRHAGDRSLRVLDVGSGAGLPGVVIALLFPEWQITCVDTVGKKASFIQQVAAELGLRQLRSEHARVEQLDAAPFDVITSRAFASLFDFTDLTGPLLKQQGVWMAMKGKRPAEEIAALPSTLEVFHVEHLTVPDLNADRCLVWIRPRAANESAR